MWHRTEMKRWPVRRSPNTTRFEPRLRSILRVGPSVRLTRCTRDGLLGKAGIIAVDDVGQQAHFADAEPFKFGVFIADVGGFAALPTRHRIDVMQRVAIDFGLPLPDRCDQPELG